jgi:anti-anti-sigma factor
MLQIRSHECHGTEFVTVLDVDGELDIATQDELERAVRVALQAGPVVVDLSGVDFLAVSALSTLLVCKQAAESAEDRLTFAGAPPQAMRLIRIAGLEVELPLGAPVTGEPTGVA